MAATGFMRFVQGALLLAYRAVRRTGVFETRAGKAAFERVYWAYKSRLEASDLEALQPHVKPGSTVIDVGANIGFFTVSFARWVGPEGRVIAIEPERANFGSLSTRVSGESLAGRVSLVNAAAVDNPGQVFLLLNPDNPADHRVAESGERVDAVTVDALVEKAGWPNVSLIKIDVQGGEMKVVRGAGATLRRLRPALFVEFHEGSLVLSGTSSKELLAELADLGYTPSVLEGGRWSEVDEGGIQRRMQERGYLDVLLVARRP